MRKSIENKKIKLTTVVVLLLFFCSTVAQAVVNATDEWEDDFTDTSHIDFSKSSNIEVEGGKVKMSNTFKAWHRPWPYMKEIKITNSGSAQPEYVLPLEISKVNGHMEDDFSDLRFVNVGSDGLIYDLEYWVGDYNSYEADTWVRVTPQVPSGTSYIYMFYGDPSAPDNSNFNTMFMWDDRTTPDIMISYKNELEGAWDPDVEFGSGRFLVAWEERLGPQRMSPPPDLERAIYSCIHGRTYNSDGGDPYPSGDADIDISPGPPDTSYHAEDPAIAYGSSKFFVAWEQNPAALLQRYNWDIYGSIVTPGGSVTQLSSPICGATGLQADPSVAYGSSKFLVAWEDARLGTSNYNIWARFYSSSGSPAGSEFQVTSASTCEAEPWVCYGDGFFFIINEVGDSPENGPYGLELRKISTTGTTIWTRTIVTGTSNLDNVYPACDYNTNTDEVFVCWNTADLSSGIRRGNIMGNFYTQDGQKIYNDNFYVQSGSNLERPDCKPYLENMFFVSYDKGDEVYGKLVYNDGGTLVRTSETALSDGSSQNLDWNNLAVSDNSRIFAVWEDDRDQVSQYSDAFGSVWHVYKSTGSPQVSYSVLSERQLVDSAILVSDVIDSTGVQKWEDFYAQFELDDANIQFFICNSAGSKIHTGLGDISNVATDDIRLRAEFSRDTGADDPYVDMWGVSFIGTDNEPPWTELYLDPEDPNGNNGWYTQAVDVQLRGYDDLSGVAEIHYKIDGGLEQVSHSNPTEFTIRDSGTHSVTYWSVDVAGNTESPNTHSGIKIDGRNPKVNIIKPDTYEQDPGPVGIEATIEETGGTEESGLYSVAIYINNNPTPVAEWHSFSDPNSFTATHQLNVNLGESYDIEVKAYDKAGNMGNAYFSIWVDPGGGTFAKSPEVGFLYTDNGASEHFILYLFDLAAYLTEKMDVWIKPDTSELGDVSEVEFVLDGRVVDKTGTAYDDGEGYYRYSFDVPTGFYSLTANYIGPNGFLESYEWPCKIIFINTL
jgi:hypothetical protein